MPTQQETQLRGAYLRRWRSQDKYKLVRARAAAGLDIGTGWYPEELVRCAELTFLARDVVFKQANGASQEEVDSDISSLEAAIQAEFAKPNLTQEYREVLRTLKGEIQRPSSLPSLQMA